MADKVVVLSTRPAGVVEEIEINLPRPSQPAFTLQRKPPSFFNTASPCLLTGPGPRRRVTEKQEGRVVNLKQTGVVEHENSKIWPCPTLTAGRLGPRSNHPTAERNGSGGNHKKLKAATCLSVSIPIYWRAPGCPGYFKDENLEVELVPNGRWAGQIIPAPPVRLAQFGDFGCAGRLLNAPKGRGLCPYPMSRSNFGCKNSDKILVHGGPGRPTGPCTSKNSGRSRRQKGLATRS